MIKVRVVTARIASPTVMEERMAAALNELDGQIEQMFMNSDDRSLMCTIVYKEKETKSEVAKKASKKVVRKAPAKVTEI